MEGDEFVNENFIRGFPELRKNIIKKKVSALVMQSLLLIIALMTTSLNNHSVRANCIYIADVKIHISKFLLDESRVSIKVELSSQQV